MAAELHCCTKDKYFAMVASYFKRNSTILAHPFNTAGYNLQMKALIKAKQAVAAGELLTYTQSKILKTYDLMEVARDGHIIQRITMKTLNQLHRELLTCEESFDVIYEAHINTDHGTRQNMMHYKDIFYRYFISPVCTDFLIRSCSVCQENEKREAETGSGTQRLQRLRNKFNDSVYVFVLRMVIEDKGPLVNNILVCVDKFTNYVRIRPLFSVEESEVAVELFKIFMDYGTPKTIDVIEMQYFQKVCATISRIYPEFYGNLNESYMSKVKILNWSTVVESQIKSHLSLKMSLMKGRMIVSHNDNWAIACYMVQFQLNNIHNSTLSNTPFVTVFGNIPNVLGASPTWTAPNKLAKVDEKCE